MKNWKVISTSSYSNSVQDIIVGLTYNQARKEAKEINIANKKCDDNCVFSAVKCH